MRNFLLKILILLVILTGVGFLKTEETNAQTSPPVVTGECRVIGGTSLLNQSKSQCHATASLQENDPRGVQWVPSDGSGVVWIKYASAVDPIPLDDTGAPMTPAEEGDQTPFEEYINKNWSCFTWKSGLMVDGCAIQIAYKLFYQLPSLFLYISAYLFNVLMVVTLSSKLFADSGFISEAWGIVRDLSNIFFILILLYIALKIILGMTGHGVKETIAKVVVMALLINFSLFFSGVVIDTSNVLALVFYNKLSVETTVDGQVRQYSSAIGEKDVAGGMVQAFNATSLLDEEFFRAAGTISVPGEAPVVGEVSAGFIFGILVVTGLLMFFTAYCFIVAGISFIGRMVELFVLLIFSPFAFMSSTIPKLSHASYVGWDEWTKKLISASFMAPIFMFYLYFIFLLIQSNFLTEFTPTGNTGMINRLILIVLPTLIILILLLKATDLAKKGSGKLGEFAGKLGGQVAGLAGGLAIGAATGGTSLALRATAGRVGADMGESKKLIEYEERGGLTGWGAGKLRDLGKYTGAASFDARGVKIGGKSLASTGLKVGDANKGFIQAQKEQMAKRQKRAEELVVGENEPAKQKLNELKLAEQNILKAYEHDLHELDEKIKDAKEDSKDATAKETRGEKELARRRVEMLEAEKALATAKDTEKESAKVKLDTAKLGLKTAQDTLKDLRDAAKKAQETFDEFKDQKKAIKSGKKSYAKTSLTDSNLKAGDEEIVWLTDNKTASGVQNNVGAGGLSLKDLKPKISHAEHAVETISRERQWNYANAQNDEEGLGNIVSLVASGGTYTSKAARETAYRIKMKDKIKNHGKDHGEDKAHDTHKEEKHEEPPAENHGGGEENHGGGHAPAGH